MFARFTREKLVVGIAIAFTICTPIQNLAGVAKAADSDDDEMVQALKWLSEKRRELSLEFQNVPGGFAHPIDSPCDSASVVIRRDGTIKYLGGNARTFCLKDGAEKDKWSPNSTYVGLRNGSQPEADTTWCNANPDTTYELKADKAPTLALQVWSKWTDDERNKPQSKAFAAAKKIVAKPTEATIDERRDALAFLALMSQSTDTETLPVVNIRIPGGGATAFKVVGLNAEEGWNNERGAKEGNDLMLFAYNMRAKDASGKEDVAAIIKGAAVTKAPSPLVEVLLNVLRLTTSAALNKAKATEDSGWQVHRPAIEAAIRKRGPISDLQPAATKTAQVVVLRSLEPNFSYDLRICSGTPCDTTTDYALIRANKNIVVLPRPRFVSTATEIGFSWGGGTSPGGWEFQPIIGSGPPSQLYRMQKRDGFADRVSISQLLIVYPLRGFEKWYPKTSESTRPRLYKYLLNRFGVALGPTLTLGGRADVFSQFNFRLAYELPFAHGILLTVGPSYRKFQFPHGVRENEVVSAGGTAPSFGVDDRWGWMWTAGLGIDLSVLGTLWEKTATTFGKEGAN